MSRMTKIGLIGTVVTALCCFTPVLVILFGAIGLSWLTGYLDIVLIPLLLIFAAFTVYSFMRSRGFRN